MLSELVWILIMFGGKYHQENANNGISDRLDFEIFWGSMPSDPLKARAFGAFATALVIRKVWLRPWHYDVIQWKRKMPM